WSAESAINWASRTSSFSAGVKRNRRIDLLIRRRILWPEPDVPFLHVLMHGRLADVFSHWVDVHGGQDRVAGAVGAGVGRRHHPGRDLGLALDDVATRTLLVHQLLGGAAMAARPAVGVRRDGDGPAAVGADLDDPCPRAAQARHDHANQAKCQESPQHRRFPGSASFTPMAPAHSGWGIYH